MREICRERNRCQQQCPMLIPPEVKNESKVRSVIAFTHPLIRLCNNSVRGMLIWFEFQLPLTHPFRRPQAWNVSAWLESKYWLTFVFCFSMKRPLGSNVLAKWVTARWMDHKIRVLNNNRSLPHLHVNEWRMVLSTEACDSVYVSVWQVTHRSEY